MENHCLNLEKSADVAIYEILKRMKCKLMFLYEIIISMACYNSSKRLIVRQHNLRHCQMPRLNK